MHPGQRAPELNPTGLPYAQFCAKYRPYQKRIDWVLPKVYTPGEHCFVDYAGPTLTVIDPVTGDTQAGQRFVAVPGFSRYTFADVHPQHTTGWWIRGHMAAFQFFAGVPRMVVLDNPKALGTKAERFDVTLIEPISHSLGIMGWPSCPPEFVARDKGHAEAGVPWVERWILAKLRHERLSEWGVARDRVATLLEALPFRNSKDPASVSGSKNGPPWPPCRPLHSKTRRNKLAATALDRIA